MGRSSWNTVFRAATKQGFGTGPEGDSGNGDPGGGRSRFHEWPRPLERALGHLAVVQQPLTRKPPQPGGAGRYRAALSAAPAELWRGVLQGQFPEWRCGLVRTCALWPDGGGPADRRVGQCGGRVAWPAYSSGRGGTLIDVVRVMEALAEQGVTVLFKADAERMRDGVRPWTFVANGLPFHEDLLVRTDASSVEGCLKVCLPQLRARGLVIPE